MPITVNAWLANHKIFGSKNSIVNNSIFTPLWAFFRGGNVGHSNIVYDFYGTEEEINKIRTHYPHLKFENVTRIQNGKEESGIQFTMSFWPKYRNRNNVGQRIKSFFNLVKGDKAVISTHREDMQSEAPDNYMTMHGFRVIDKSKPATPDNIEYPVLDKLHEIRTLEDLVSIQKKLREFCQQEHDKCEKYAKSNIAQYYKKQYEKRKNQEQLKNKTQQLSDDIAALDSSIAEMERRIAELRTSLPVQSKDETFTRDIFITDGMHPDVSIPLVTHDANGVQIIDEFKVLDEMQRQAIDNNNQYSLFTHNCCDAAKECLEAGISDDKKQQMKSSKKSSSIFSHPGNFIAWVFAFTGLIRGNKKEMQPAAKKPFEPMKYTRQF